MRGDGGLDQGDCSGSGEKWLNYLYTLKLESIGFAYIHRI